MTRWTIFLMTRGMPNLEWQLRAKSFVAATPAQIRESFGGIARPNPSNQYGNTSLEGGAHGSIHNYVGGTRSPVEAGDMSDFTTAARDPIFFAHHGNLDRLWETWRSDPNRKASEPSTDNFLKHKFPFTWIDGTTLEVSVEDTLNTGRLGYTYDTLDVFRPAAVVMAGKEMSKPDAMAEHKAQWMAAESKIEKTAQSRLPPSRAKLWPCRLRRTCLQCFPAIGHLKSMA